jgi:hypothetical protein
MRNYLTPAERQTRIAEKQRLILRFLRDETWTHVDVVQLLLGFQTVQPAYKFLKKLEALELLKSSSMPVAYGRDITLWGITANGLAHSFDDSEVYLERPTFSISRVSASTMQHKIDLQVIRVLAEGKGFSSWSDGSQLGLRKSGLKVPDAVARLGDRTIAIEVERTIKTAKRYADVISSHLRASRDGHWDVIYYFCPDEVFRKRLTKVFFSIKQLKFKGQTVELTDAHFSKFKFFIYDDLRLKET